MRPRRPPAQPGRVAPPPGAPPAAASRTNSASANGLHQHRPSGLPTCPGAFSNAGLAGCRPISRSAPPRSAQRRSGKGPVRRSSPETPERPRTRYGPRTGRRRIPARGCRRGERPLHRPRPDGRRRIERDRPGDRREPARTGDDPAIWPVMPRPLPPPDRGLQRSGADAAASSAAAREIPIPASGFPTARTQCRPAEFRIRPAHPDRPAGGGSRPGASSAPGPPPTPPRTPR